MKSSFLFDIDKFKKLPRIEARARSQQEDDANGPRLLFVTDYVPFDDFDKDEHKNILDTGAIFSGPHGQIFTNLLKKLYRENDQRFREIVVFNWNNVNVSKIHKDEFESNQLRDNTIKQYSDERLRAFILKMKPDIVLISGMDAFVSFMERYERRNYPKNVNWRNKFGRLLDITLDDIKTGGHTFKIMGSVDLRRAGTQIQEEIKKYTNLLGFVYRSLETALEGENRYNVEIAPVTFKNINTIKKFKKFMRKLRASRLVSIDSEGAGLKRIVNTLFSIQFTFNEDLTTSYFIPLEHPQTPFNAKQIAYIKSELKHYFEFGEPVTHVYQNAKFDIQQFIAQFGVRFYNHRVYDTIAGEFALDENRKLLAKKGGTGSIDKPFALDAIAEYYGIDIYSRIKFSKGDRGDMSSADMDKDFIKYACLDTVVPLYVMRCQLREAKRVGSKSFKRFILNVISNTILAIAQMEHTGAYIDKEYLESLRGPNSDLNKQAADLLQSILDTPEVKKANRLIVEKRNIPMGFKQPWVFKIGEKVAKQTLFFEVMGLQPVKLNKDGTGSVGKAFKDKYKNLPIMKALDRYDKILKLRSTYVDGFHKKLRKDADCSDGHIRASYDWAEITSGRLNSRDPNLQNIVSRGDDAKTIKDCFIAHLWQILVKNDYSAHEVREFANIGEDTTLSGTFDKGAIMRRKLRVLMDKYREEAEDWRQRKIKIKWADIKEYDEKKKIVNSLNNPNTAEIAALDLELEVFGDIHKINSNHFFGTPVLEVTKDQRQSVKAVIFGVLYGKGAKGLAESLGITEEAAQKLIDLFFAKFAEGGKWIRGLIKEAARELKVKSPSGMERHLWAYLHNKQGVLNAMDRRGPNAVIQGLASQHGVDSIRNIQKLIWNYLIRQEIDAMWKVVTNYVHDSVESQNWIHMLPLHLYFVEHASTTLVHKNYSEIHGMNFKVGFEMEFQMGPTMAKLDTWGWGSAELREIAQKTVDWHVKRGGDPRIGKRIMKAFDVNSNIISKIRAKELKAFGGKANAIETEMLLKPQHMKKLGFVFNVEGVQ